MYLHLFWALTVIIYIDCIYMTSDCLNQCHVEEGDNSTINLTSNRQNSRSASSSSGLTLVDWSRYDHIPSSWIVDRKTGKANTCQYSEISIGANYSGQSAQTSWEIDQQPFNEVIRRIVFHKSNFSVAYFNTHHTLILGPNGTTVNSTSGAVYEQSNSCFPPDLLLEDSSQCMLHTNETYSVINPVCSKLTGLQLYEPSTGFAGYCDYTERHLVQYNQTMAAVGSRCPAVIPNSPNSFHTIPAGILHSTCSNSTAVCGGTQGMCRQKPCGLEDILDLPWFYSRKCLPSNDVSSNHMYSSHSVASLVHQIVSHSSKSCSCIKIQRKNGVLRTAPETAAKIEYACNAPICTAIYDKFTRANGQVCFCPSSAIHKLATQRVQRKEDRTDIKGSFDGSWSVWSWWSRCTLSCGGGLWTRTRSCTSPSPSHRGTPCTGNLSVETRPCNTNKCPVIENKSSTAFSDLVDTATIHLSTIKPKRMKNITITITIENVTSADHQHIKSSRPRKDSTSSAGVIEERPTFLNSIPNWSEIALYALTTFNCTALLSLWINRWKRPM